MKPSYWGNIIYEATMGLYITETEAKEESWGGENFFPLYEESQIKELEAKILDLIKLNEAYTDKIFELEDIQEALNDKFHCEDISHSEKLHELETKLLKAETKLVSAKEVIQYYASDEYGHIRAFKDCDDTREAQISKQYPLIGLTGRRALQWIEDDK